MKIWHPSRDVGVASRASSTISSSSSSGGGRRSKSSWLKITWQVEQDIFPSQDPCIGTPLSCAMSSTRNPACPETFLTPPWDETNSTLTIGASAGGWGRSATSEVTHLENARGAKNPSGCAQ
eukprot:CAMPEP_0114540292 /NCGR_PEP_ID=MMETSP0114-20121206/684_1 /TAXON_ID=31324 /ORGANISM="Goniomonas sp, Strain m" /LENGTH=121 /DNA_ID=CAMNT_0001724433 /DNA_START=32 /DNA_END=394 /DNA_ORIENTATION=+